MLVTSPYLEEGKGPQTLLDEKVAGFHNGYTTLMTVFGSYQVAAPLLRRGATSATHLFHQYLQETVST